MKTLVLFKSEISNGENAKMITDELMKSDDFFNSVIAPVVGKRIVTRKQMKKAVDIMENEYKSIMIATAKHGSIIKWGIKFIFINA